MYLMEPNKKIVKKLAIKEDSKRNHNKVKINVTSKLKRKLMYKNYINRLVIRAALIA